MPPSPRCVGAGIGFLMVGRSRGRVPLGVALIVLAPMLHGLWNSPVAGVAVAARRLPGGDAVHRVGGAARDPRRSEYLWFRDVLSAPGALGAIPPEYLGAVRPTWWQRRTYRASVARTYGRAALAPQRAVEAELTDLADAVDVGDEAAADALRARLATRLLQGASD